MSRALTASAPCTSPRRACARLSLVFQHSNTYPKVKECVAIRRRGILEKKLHALGDLGNGRLEGRHVDGGAQVDRRLLLVPRLRYAVAFA